MGNAQKPSMDNTNVKSQNTSASDPRKARTRELIQIGGLAEIAGLVKCEPGALLGFFLQAKVMLEDEETYQNLKIFGDSVLKERALSRKAKQKSRRKVR